jgi:hypothetical protein
MIVPMTIRALPPAALLFTLLFPGGIPPHAPSPQTPRIVAVGDIHGAYEPFVEILQSAGLVDPQQNWVGGNTIFVQTGDCLDRGAKIREVLDLLMRLEDQARRAGGRTELLLGNHEVMNLVHDFRDVAPEAFASFADERSEDRRRRAYDEYARAAKRGGSDASVLARDAWMAEHPQGFLEYADAFGPSGKYGRWLRSHKVVVNVGGILFMHAGIRPEATSSIDEVNRVAAREIAQFDQTKALMVKANLAQPFFTLRDTVMAASSELERMVARQKADQRQPDYVTQEFAERLLAVVQVDKWSLFHPDGPLWYRGYAKWTDADTDQAKALLDRLGATRFVTAHTPTLPGRITSRAGNHVFLIDTGMLSNHFKGGRASALEIQGERITAIYGTEREVLVGAAEKAEGTGTKGTEGTGREKTRRRGEHGKGG